VPWTRNENFVPTELLMTAIFLLVLLVCCGLTYRFVEVPMQRMGRRVARRLDARFGKDIPRQPAAAAAEDMILTRQ
jgi:peptidoglycan/LPS O-acetylase OafA/YrhL